MVSGSQVPTVNRRDQGRPKSAVLLEPANAHQLYGPEGMAEIERTTDLVARIEEPRMLRHNPGLLAGIEVLFTGWGCPRLDAAVLSAAPRLQAVFFAGGTIRSWVTDSVWERDLLVVSAYQVNAIPVAEYTTAAILFSLKRGWHYLGRQQRERCYPGPIIPAPGACRSVVGLISLGAIGRLVRERLRAFDLEIVGHDPFVTPAEAAGLGVTLLSLDEVFRRSDVVSLHAPLLPATEGMITGAHLDLLKAGATFINTARGRIVRETEMAVVLGRRPDLTAVLDVMAEEPPSPGNPLPGLPNVFITPHIAGSLGGECRRMGAFVLEQFHQWQRGGPLQGRITRQSAPLLA